MAHNYSGTFTVIDGLDGVGKGVVQQAIQSYLEQQKMRIFDLHSFWQKKHDHPDFNNPKRNDKDNPLYVNLDDFDVILSSEPTFIGIGKSIRFELIENNQRLYSAHMTARSYSIDRAILYKRVLLPALKAGKHVIQSRSVSTSIVYQPLQKLEAGEPKITINQIIKMDGNNLALEHAPGLLIIPTITDIVGLLDRLKKRKKDDNCQFETIEFQKKIKPLYESKQLKDIFEKRGTTVAYLDAGISIEDSKRQALEIFKETFPNL